MKHETQKKIVTLLLAMLLSLSFTACNTPSKAPTDLNSPSKQNDSANHKEYKFVMVCNVLAEPFWTTVRKGMEEAAELLDVDARYIGPQEYDIRQQVQTFETIIDTDIDGAAVFISEGNSLEPVIEKALAKGIPVVTFNNDYPNSKRMAYIGQGEYAAGQQMGREICALVPDGSTILAGNHHPGQTAIDERIRGVESVTQEHNITIEQVVTPEMNPSEVMTTLEGAYAKNPNIKAFLAFNPQVGSIMAQWVEEKGITDKIAIGSFDMLPQLLEYIQKGNVKFTIDQQPYLQGFQSIMQLYLYKKYGLHPTDINTGGAVINKDNVDQVIDLVNKGYR